MKRMAWLLACVLALALGISDGVFAGEPEGEIEVGEVRYNGSGCPQGTAELIVAQDGKSFSLVFNEFAALAGPGIPLAQSRRNCVVNFSARVPEGFTWGVGGVRFQGLAKIAGGGTGLHTTTYFVQGQAQQATSSHQFMSPFQGSWSHSDEFDADDALFVPCGLQRSFNINTSLRVSAGNDPNDRVSFAMMRTEQVFQLLVKRCPS